MGSVREAEEAIRRYNGFRIERHTLKVQVALSEEDKKKRQQQKLVTMATVELLKELQKVWAQLFKASLSTPMGVDYVAIGFDMEIQPLVTHNAA